MFLLQSKESSEFHEVAQIDYQKIRMTATGFNQELVMIDQFNKYAVAKHCKIASAEETSDMLPILCIARHGSLITSMLDNGKAFVGGLPKALMKGPQVKQAQSTSYHPQTNGLAD